MFTINEIERENQQSVFPRFFFFLAKSIRDVCGRSGEGAVREAVREFAAKRGVALRETHRSAGRKQNVQSYQCASDEIPDGRRQQVFQILNEEVCVKDIHSCPWANLWRQYPCGEIPRWFCEEYEKGKFEAYTIGKGQIHLSQLLPEPRNNHCRLAMYFRKANLSEEEGRECFSEDRTSPADPEDRTEAFYRSTGAFCLDFYRELYAVVSQRFGEEGLCAVAAGLKEFSQDAIRVLRDQAKRTLRPCDRNFAEKNFPFALEDRKPFSVFGPEEAAAGQMLEGMLLSPVRAALEQREAEGGC